jgi:hypothetical protein
LTSPLWRACHLAYTNQGRLIGKQTDGTKGWRLDLGIRDGGLTYRKKKGLRMGIHIDAVINLLQIFQIPPCASTKVLKI